MFATIECSGEWELSDYLLSSSEGLLSTYHNGMVVDSHIESDATDEMMIDETQALLFYYVLGIWMVLGDGILNYNLLTCHMNRPLPLD